MAATWDRVNIPPMFLLAVFIAEPPVPPIAAVVTLSRPTRGGVTIFPIYAPPHEWAAPATSVAVEMVHQRAVTYLGLVAVVRSHCVDPAVLRAGRRLLVELTIEVTRVHRHNQAHLLKV
ncbi:MAG: hypothetical protein ACXACF_06625 [Candidatus Hermodarchaeia archaeon]